MGFCTGLLQLELVFTTLTILCKIYLTTPSLIIYPFFVIFLIYEKQIVAMFNVHLVHYIPTLTNL